MPVELPLIPFPLALILKHSQSHGYCSYFVMPPRCEYLSHLLCSISVLVHFYKAKKRTEGNMTQPRLTATAIIQ